MAIMHNGESSNILLTSSISNITRLAGFVRMIVTYFEFLTLKMSTFHSVVLLLKFQVCSQNGLESVLNEVSQSR